MRSRKIFAILTVFFILALLLLLGKSSLYRFLAVTHRIDAPVLVVEGWIGPKGLTEAVAEIKQHAYRKVIVAGLLYPFDTTQAYEVSGVGGLVFDLSQQTVPTTDTLTVRAAGTTFQQIPAEFSVWINDTLIGEAYTSDAIKEYPFSVDAIVPRTVSVVFENDQYERDVGDRNLLVQSIRLGSATFYARMPYVRYDRGEMDGQRLARTDYRSEAEEAMEYLRNQGIADSLLTLVTTPYVDYDRTYATAVAVEQWLHTHPEVPPVVHVFSQGAHARRSWLTFQKALGSERHVGVIASQRTNDPPWWGTPSGRAYVMTQVAKYLYAKFFFWP